VCSSDLGKEAIKKLIAIDPSVKAIVSSGYSNDPVMSDYQEYGFKGVVAKPYKLAEISEVLHKVIKGKSPV
jgi:DNA-binding NarL/FixJ family response regulator